MQKLHCQISFDNPDCLKAAEEYLKKWLWSFEFSPVSEIEVKELSLVIHYYPGADIEDTDQIDERIVGFRDGYKARMSGETK